MSDPKDLNEFDHIVDEVIDDAKKAEMLKKALHEKLGKKPKSGEKSEAEDDDRWDNVPL